MSTGPRMSMSGELLENPDFKEILRLHEMLEEAGIAHELCRRMDGWQVWYPSREEAVADAIEDFASYGAERDLLELMGLLSEEEFKVDNVKGFLTADDVFARMKAHWEQKENEQ